MDLYALDETLEYLNNGKIQSLEDILESIIEETDQFSNITESCIISEKVDFSKVKDKIVKIWESIKAKIKAFIAKIEFHARELARKTRTVTVVKKLIPDKLTVKSAINFLGGAAKFGFKARKDIIAQMKNKPSIFDDEAKAGELADKYLKENPIEISTIDTDIVDTSDRKRISDFISYSNHTLNSYQQKCDKFEKLSKKYFDTYFGYDDIKSFSSYGDIESAFSEPGEWVRKDALDKNETDSKYFTKLEIPETFRKKVTVDSFDEIDKYFGNSGDYIEEYFSILCIKDSEDKLINKLRLIVKSGDNTINKIKSELHKSEKDPTFYMRSYIESCNTLLQEGLAFNKVLSNYEAYYKKLYNETLHSAIIIAEKYLDIANHIYAEMKKEDN